MPATQVVHVLAAALDRFPASHARQALDPGFAYLPAVHTVQEPGEDAPINIEAVPPVQLVQTEEAKVLANVPDWQGTHVLADVAKGVPEKVPVLHGEHMLESAVVVE